MRRRGTIAFAALLLAVGVLLAGALPAAGAPVQEDGTDETTDSTPVPEQDIIPRPDSGRAPEEAGDRGGALQLAVLGGVLAGVGLIVFLAVRESRRNRPHPAEPAPHA
jgi:hypothetical protein